MIRKFCVSCIEGSLPYLPASVVSCPFAATGSSCWDTSLLGQMIQNEGVQIGYWLAFYCDSMCVVLEYPRVSVSG